VSILAISDLVLDVANAADPARRKMALERLNSLSKSAAPNMLSSGTGFADHIEAQSPFSASPPDDVAAMRTALDAVHDHPMPHGTQSGLQKFEAFILGNFIGLMMPKDNEAVYGKGMAGDMWQSLSAQYIGDAIAKRGGIGLAARLAPHYPHQTAPTQG